MPGVSVVLPTYKRPQLLQRAVASVQRQTLTDWELIVTDDEDPPGETWTYLLRLADQDPRVRICRNPGPHGQSGNVNNALRCARAEWVKLLYDDDVLRPGCLETLVKAIAGAGSVAVATCLCDRYSSGRLVGQQHRGNRPRIQRIPHKTVHLAMYLQDVDIGTPTQMMVHRSGIECGVLFEDHEGLVSGVDIW
jgi:glycosyltransferase involved in cell wall biosynthesis